jgi:hypothetical protein
MNTRTTEINFKDSNDLIPIFKEVNPGTEGTLLNTVMCWSPQNAGNLTT